MAPLNRIVTISTLLGWSSIVQAMWHWIHSASKDDSRSSPNDNTLPINNEESQAKLKSDDGCSPVSINSPTGQGENTLADDESVFNSDDEDNIPTLNDVESLKKGIIKTSKNKANRPYTILLVGETGVGKSSVLEFIANVLHGNDIDHYNFDTLDHTNEQHRSYNQSQTNPTHLCEFTSKNGIVVRILNTPGLADTRSLQQDELHKKSITAQIKEHIDSITAVLVLANGTVPHMTVRTDYALSTLSAIFPKTLAKNIAFVFTNVSGPLYWNFSGDTIPEVLKGAPQFFLNNPIALQRKLLRHDPIIKKGGMDLRNIVKADEKEALEMLVALFDWLDGLDRPARPGVVRLYEKSQNIAIIVTGSLAQQMKQLLRMLIEKGIRTTRRISTGW